MNIKTIHLSTLATVLLAGCGGGSSGGSPPPATSTPTPPPVVSKLSGYVGNWVAACDVHGMAAMVITDTPGVPDSVDVEIKSEYYMNSDCTGALVGKMNSKYSAAYSGTADTATMFKPDSPSVQAKLDLLTLRTPRNSTAMAGPGVVHTVKDGEPRWCMSFTNGESTCVQDVGVEARGPFNGAFYANDNKLYLLSPRGSVYSTDEIYTRR